MWVGEGVIFWCVVRMVKVFLWVFCNTHTHSCDSVSHILLFYFQTASFYTHTLPLSIAFTLLHYALA